MKFTDSEYEKIVKKLEYTFRKSDDEIIKKIVELTDEPSIKFSNLKQQKKKIEKEKLKHLKEYQEFLSEK